MNRKKIVIDTDIVLDHLMYRGSSSRERRSLLTRIMNEYFCYTTVFNAIELFSLCRRKDELETVAYVPSSLKLLGMNGKSAKNLGPLLATARKNRMRDFDALIAGVCIESRLSRLTRNPKRYKGLRSLSMVNSRNLTMSNKQAEGESE